MPPEIFSLVPSQTVYMLYLLFFGVGVLAMFVAAFVVKKTLFRVLIVAWGIIMIGAGAMIYCDSQARFYITETRLVIDQGLSEKNFPLDMLDRNKARTVDLMAEPEFGPWYKTMGTGMPGFNTGWFVLRDEREAYLFLTDTSRPAVLIPTTENYVLLLSVENAGAFLEKLRPEASGREETGED